METSDNKDANNVKKKVKKKDKKETEEKYTHNTKVWEKFIVNIDT